ncbi:MAG TPA: single-stranded-DNA-specific exonuclease RecJ, partial [Vicinamibacterales bacterium]|nr:single-stranded-DNA-specific exonuclease RecJ [Vicinamibacterales bacterium]
MPTLLWAPVPCDETRVAPLAAALGVTTLTARLLCQRGLAAPEEAARFLAPSLAHLHDPFLLTGMAEAVDRLQAAVARHERIAIHGDYDVDGITSTVILRRMIEGLGGDVVHVLPERLTDGYGLLPPAIERFHADGVRVVVSVDCGIRSGAAARRARELGLDLIVTDHHEPEADLPPALAVINPKRADCRYPDKHLAGVGVALKLVQALCGRAGREKWLPAFVKMAAIGTLADVVPLVGENRVIASAGLGLLSRGPHKVGLQALIEVAGLAGKAIGSYEVGFLLAPRLNAAGRMASPEIAARLLLASDPARADEARALAGQLNDENLRRQAQEQEIVAAARKSIEADPAIGARSVLVVAGEGWHRGVIGIVASKLVDAFHRPVVVISIDDGVAHGSCRSIPAFDMLAALDACAPHLTRYGGHKGAAGLTLEADGVKAFRSAIQQYGDDRLQPDDLRPRLRIDAPLGFADIKGKLVEELRRIEPFGLGNPRPVFAAGPVQIVDGPRRVKERHLKLAIRQQGRVFRAMAWRAVEREREFVEHRAALD